MPCSHGSRSSVVAQPASAAATSWATHPGPFAVLGTRPSAPDAPASDHCQTQVEMSAFGPSRNVRLLVGSSSALSLCQRFAAEGGSIVVRFLPAFCSASNRSRNEATSLRPSATGSSGSDDRARRSAPAGCERAPSLQARAAISIAAHPHQPRTMMATDEALLQREPGVTPRRLIMRP